MKLPKLSKTLHEANCNIPGSRLNLNPGKIQPNAIDFVPNWRLFEDFPLSKKRVRKILKSAGGRVGYAAKTGQLIVRQSVHSGGRPGIADNDPAMHITVTITDPEPRETCHIRLAANGNIREISCR